MGGSRAAEDVPIKELSQQEAGQEAGELFDRICRREMRISATEFLQRWDAGEYDRTDVDSVPGLADVAMALPLIREI